MKWVRMCASKNIGGIRFKDLKDFFFFRQNRIH